jgi:hypothetical protein
MLEPSASWRMIKCGCLMMLSLYGSGLSFRLNAFKECEEEASIPRTLLEERLRPAGLISYRYQTRKGLSTKFLNVYVGVSPDPGVCIWGGPQHAGVFFSWPVDGSITPCEALTGD